MHPIREDDDVLARLESRLELLADTLNALRARNAELEKQASDALASRDSAVVEVDEVRDQLARLTEENEALRARQREAVSRIKTILAQVEQMDLLTEG